MQTNATCFLQNISFSVKQNELLGVVGAVGSGKSTLLLALAGELSNVYGDLRVNGRMFYVSQEPWVYSATVRENILFGRLYDETKFREIVKVCALDEVADFENGFPSVYSTSKAS
jgi:ATP-binding cassette subfamily C (CFTR/MRP) protein 4